MPDLTHRGLIRKAAACEREAVRLEAFEEASRAKADKAAQLAASLRRTAVALRSEAQAMEGAKRAPALRIGERMDSVETPHKGPGRPIERRTKLRDAMDAAGLTCEVLAKKLGRSTVTVMTWMGGFREPPKAIKDAICAILPTLGPDDFPILGS